MSSQSTLAGIELGGTKSIAVVAVDGEIVDRKQVATTLPSQTLPPLVEWLAQRAPVGGFAALGIATFGPARIAPGRPDFGHIATTPKPGWSGASIVEPFARRLNCPIRLDTDVNAAALAEYRWGAAKGCDSVAYVTIGTGVGVGVLVNGHPVHGRLHPEAGHLSLRRLPDDPFAGACPFHGDCVEGLISGPALAARFAEDPANVTPKDPRWEGPAYDFAELLIALILTLSPQRILVGGGAGLGAAHLLSASKALLPSRLADYLPDVTSEVLDGLIRPAGLGVNAGPLGAVALAIDAAGKAFR